ncbi:replication factor C subunit 2 [Radiomyces spectabilis]|uniref:replication factor C subunit 2 n=1 Tax=Radiomyces spectabilis TaxID=64574 RepID=UPI00221E6DD9|nr:replication factor C subunit 2 [Radiomyces spectabilis]KAI8374187.1 replication factor C subunit 2 [Radiomyces spectabilis]
MNFFQPRSAGATHTKANVPKKTNKPWVEKYRPKTMDDIASQEQAVLVLKKALQSDNLPHLLFYGPPGTGKTSTILALAHELYGPIMRSRILELNASDERGIQIIREKVKDFSRSTVTQTVSGYPCPRFKIVILDEADSMTNDAQSALRRTMETYSATTRFCLICNYVSRIIEPITSRCAKFRFKPLPMDDLTLRINMICDSEKVKLAPGAMDALIRASNGDLRKAITFLQSGSNLHKDEDLTSKTINEMAGIIPPETLNILISTWETNDYKQIQQAIQTMMNAGYSAENILTQLHEEIVRNENLTTLQKSKISQVLANADIDLIHGADEHLQILNLMLSISSIIAE